ncbi:MAG: hypothetical protein AAF500_05820 [Myxococcota bacterium]
MQPLEETTRAQAVLAGLVRCLPDLLARGRAAAKRSCQSADARFGGEISR